MDKIDDAAIHSRLAIRLITGMIYQDRLPQAKFLLSEYSEQARLISDRSKRGLILSQFARLHTRLGQADTATRMFAEVAQLSAEMTGREAQVNKGLLAINQARVLRLKDAMETLEAIDAIFIRDPIFSEVVMIERMLKNLMPTEVSASLR